MWWWDDDDDDEEEEEEKEEDGDDDDDDDDHNYELFHIFQPEEEDEDCETDYRVTFTAHITAKTMSIPDELWDDFQFECLAFLNKRGCCRKWESH